MDFLTNFKPSRIETGNIEGKESMLYLHSNGETMVAKLEQKLRQTLGLPPTEFMNLDQNFAEIGVDSLMGLGNWKENSNEPKIPTLQRLLRNMEECAESWLT